MASPTDPPAMPSSFIHPPPPNQRIKRPGLPPEPPTKLKRGDIVAFSVSPTATAAEYDPPRLNQLLQQLTYNKYLAVVTGSTIVDNPSVVQGYASTSASAKVELLRLAYVGSTPPSNSMIGSQELLALLPEGSMAFATMQLDHGRSPADRSEHAPTTRPPLQVTGTPTLPFAVAFVYTTSSTQAHLSLLNEGSSSLRLADGELSRLSYAVSVDTGAIASASTRLRQIAEKSSQPIMVTGEGEDDTDSASEVLGPEYPPFTHVVVDVWTNPEDVGQLEEPAGFKAELVEIERAIAESYIQAPIAIEDWVEDTKRESSTMDYSTRAFRLGVVLGIGVGVLGMVILRHVKQLQR